MTRPVLLVPLEDGSWFSAAFTELAQTHPPRPGATRGLPVLSATVRGKDGPGRHHTRSGEHAPRDGPLQGHRRISRAVSAPSGHPLATARWLTPDLPEP